MKKSAVFVPLFVLIFFSSMYEIIATVIFNYDSTLWFKFYSILEFFILLYVFHRLFKKKYLKPLLLLSFSYLLTVFLIFDRDSFFNFLAGEAYLNTFTTVLVVLGCGLWFKNYIRNSKELKLFSNPFLYFLSGLLLYFCGTFFFFLLGEVMYNSFLDGFLKFWYLNLFFNTILRFALIMGIWKELKE